MPLNELDTEQRNAASASSDEIAVSAGAGSGKTRLLVSRYLHFIRKDHLPLSSIAAITFTNKAANQMKARIAEKARELAVNDPMWNDIALQVHHAPVSTIHSFCSSILRSFPAETGVDPFFTIIDEISNTGLKREVIDRFVLLRLNEEPENMMFLLDTFGMRDFKYLMRILLDKRTHTVKFLDNLGHSNPIDTEMFEQVYEENLSKQVHNYLKVLREFHAFRPGDDTLTVVYDDLTSGLADIITMLEKRSVNLSLCTKPDLSTQSAGRFIKKMGGSTIKTSKDRY